MAEFNLIKIDGKPLEKLIEVISNGVGALYRPISIKKDAEAKAFEIEIIERAKSKALAEGKEIDAITINKIQERILFQEINRQNNIDKITKIATELISSEKEVSNEPVDKDWTTRFFRIIEDISDEEMQSLWARILSGEVKQPKSFSLRTLELLKNLSKNEAEIFTKFANITISNKDNSMIFNDDNDDFLLKEFGITFKDILLMTELGLLVNKSNLTFSFPASTDNTNSLIKYGKKGIVLYKEGTVPEQEIRVLPLTKIGTELAKLIEQPFNKMYIEKICEKYIHPSVKIEYGDLITFPDGSLNLSNKVVFKK